MSDFEDDHEAFWCKDDDLQNELEELRALYGDDYEPDEGPDPSLSAAERSPSLLKR